MGADPQAVVEAARPVAEHHSQTGFGFQSPSRCSAWRRINVLWRMGSSPANVMTTPEPLTDEELDDLDELARAATPGPCSSTEVTNTPGSCRPQSRRTRAKRPSCSSRTTMRTGPMPSTVRCFTSRISQHH
jgi:hypothetical protein